jgi:hypothetical protein
MRLSVIVSTYNQPAWLEKVLRGYAAQTHADFELLVADDGSGPETAEVLRRAADRTALNLRHVWHEDRGYRRSVVLNRAIVAPAASTSSSATATASRGATSWRGMQPGPARPVRLRRRDLAGSRHQRADHSGRHRERRVRHPALAAGAGLAARPADAAAASVGAGGGPAGRAHAHACDLEPRQRGRVAGRCPGGQRYGQRDALRRRRPRARRAADERGGPRDPGPPPARCSSSWTTGGRTRTTRRCGATGRTGPPSGASAGFARPTESLNCSPTPRCGSTGSPLPAYGMTSEAAAKRWIVGVDLGGTNIVVGVLPIEGGDVHALRVRPRRRRAAPSSWSTGSSR